jgi:hypothetical protein
MPTRLYTSLSFVFHHISCIYGFHYMISSEFPLSFSCNGFMDYYTVGVFFPAGAQLELVHILFGLLHSSQLKHRLRFFAWIFASSQFFVRMVNFLLCYLYQTQSVCYINHFSSNDGQNCPVCSGVFTTLYCPHSVFRLSLFHITLCFH